MKNKIFYLKLLKNKIIDKFFEYIHNIINKITELHFFPYPKPRQISFLKIISFFSQKAHNKARFLIGDIFDKNYNLDEKYIIIHEKENNFTNKDVILIAHWDKDNIIDPYVIFSAQHFKNIGKSVILCSACELQDISRENNIFDAIIYRTCNGYDFTSWKAAFEAYPSLYTANEVTLCNDSVFSPIGDYGKVYSIMSYIKCDFWGLTLSREIIPHMQSFHMVFRKKCLQHQAFKQIISSIAQDITRDSAIDYEIRIPLFLEINGLTAGCYRPYRLYLNIPYNPTHLWYKCIRDGIPLIKREVFKIDINIMLSRKWSMVEKMYPYTTQLIKNFLKRYL